MVFFAGLIFVAFIFRFFLVVFCLFLGCGLFGLCWFYPFVGSGFGCHYYVVLSFFCVVVFRRCIFVFSEFKLCVSNLFCVYETFGR